jgi:hypothetical protein
MTSGTSSGSSPAWSRHALVERPKRSYDRAFAVLAFAAKAAVVLLVAWAIRRI